MIRRLPGLDGRTTTELPRRQARLPATRTGSSQLLSRLAPQAHWVMATLAYALLAVWTTWPAAARFRSEGIGGPGDATGMIALIRYRIDLGVGPLSSAVTPLENAPFGNLMPGATSLPQVLVEGPLQLLAMATGDVVVAYNVFVLLGLTTSALAAYLVCRHVTGSVWAALVAGAAYGFNPWIVERAQGHVHFTFLWSLPVVLLALIRIRAGAGRRWWVVLAGGVVGGAYTNTYFAVFLGTMLTAFAIAECVPPLARRRWRAAGVAGVRSAAAFGLLVAALLPQAAWAMTHREEMEQLLAGTRSRADIDVYGSRWFEWLVPSHSHPVFSDWSEPFRVQRLHGSNLSETALYVGVTVLALALVGLVTAIADRRSRPREARSAALAAVTVGAGLIVSLPGTISLLGIEVKTPATAISLVVDGWRVYSRLFAVVQLGLVVFAAIGLALMIRRLPMMARAATALGAGGLIMFDLLSRSMTFNAVPPPVYRAVAGLPGDAPRVEYPLSTPLTIEHLVYIFQTEAAGRPLVNGGRPQSWTGGLHGRLADPAAPWTARVLAALGTRYAVVHPQQDPRPGSGFRLLGEYEFGQSLYEVAAPPARVFAVPGDGFGLVEPAARGRFTQWLERSKGTLVVYNSTPRAARVRISFTAAPFAGARTLILRDRGKAVATTRLTEPRRIGADLRVEPGVNALEIAVDPAPTPIADVVPGSADPRSVAVQISGVTVEGPGSEAITVG